MDPIPKSAAKNYVFHVIVNEKFVQEHKLSCGGSGWWTFATLFITKETLRMCQTKCVKTLFFYYGVFKFFSLVAFKDK